MFIPDSILSFLSVITPIVHVIGLINAAHAVMFVRSSRGAIAWSISLITFPWLALPLYWVFGRTEFRGYADMLRSAYLKHYELVSEVYHEIVRYRASLPPSLMSLEHLAEKLTGLPFTNQNAIALLIDGQQTYTQMLNAICNAKDYILFQFYIVEDDETGQRFRDALVNQAKQGVRIYFLYDGIGSYDLPRSYVRSLQKAGIQVRAFRSTKGKGNRFQLNFRNHRKILVVDGKLAFLGGLNIGDEYLGCNTRLSPWRDTHLLMQGPTVQVLQRVFLGDWYWATGQIPDVCWQVTGYTGPDETALVFPSGPADTLAICTLFFVDLINHARSRLWIASPYFVPDDSVLTALKLAALRDVDVRIILPNRPDHLLVYLCSFSYYSEMLTAGVKLYRHQKGFMHQKVILVDEMIAGVGTVNLDNRSFFLNFEVMGFVAASRFVKTVDQMLQLDLDNSCLVELKDYERRSLGFKLAVRTSRLLSPIL